MMRISPPALIGAAVLFTTLSFSDTALAGSRFFLFDFGGRSAQSNRYVQPDRYMQNQVRTTNQVRRGTVRMPAQFQRQTVAYDGGQPAGTIIVNTGQKFLYYVLGNGQAIRYGIGTARSGFEWSGTHAVSSKREWPGWTPPPQMRKRQPELPAYMPGGLDNPLGARAIYIGSTLYRIHGTNQPWTIGQNVSSGCIRMINDDVEDLYGRVKIGAKVIVL